MFNRNSKVINEAYLAWIRQRPCVACGKAPVDADHLKARGFGEGKRNDLTALPMCRKCHIERGQIGNEKFQIKHRIDLWEEAFWCLCEFCVLQSL